jgi:hypothetical protein
MRNEINLRTKLKILIRYSKYDEIVKKIFHATVSLSITKSNEFFQNFMDCFIADEELDCIVLLAGHHLGRGLSHSGWNSGNPHASKIINPIKVLKK